MYHALKYKLEPLVKDIIEEMVMNGEIKVGVAESKSFSKEGETNTIKKHLCLIINNQKPFPIEGLSIVELEALLNENKNKIILK